MRIFIIILLFINLLLGLDCNAQNQVIDGYREILYQRFEVQGQHLWFNQRDANLQYLIEIIFNYKKQVLIPLEFIDHNSDTTVLFFISAELKRFSKRRQFSFTTSDKSLREISYYSVKKPKFDEFKMDFDSIYTVMKENIRINTERFDLEKIIDEDVSLICKRFQSEDQRFAFLYLFFVNGILLSEDPHTNSLYYLPY